MRSLLVGGLVVGFALLLPSAAQACSCAGSEDPEKQAKMVLDYSDGAFIGILKSKRELGSGSGPLGESLFTYRVRDGFGVRLNKRIKLRTSDSSASCGLPGRVGRKYALGISGKPGDWSSSLCSFMQPKALRAVAGRGAKASRSGASSTRPPCDRA